VYATPLRRGVAFIGPLDTPAEVLARADAAMYARKAERRERHSAFGGA
jgi:PleD family two-component response regulator